MSAIPDPLCSRPLGTLCVERLADADAFESLAPEWGCLDDSLSPRTPFTSSLWNTLWWKHFRENRPVLRDNFFVHTVRGESGELIAVAPMMLTHRPAVGPLRARVLQFFGTDTNLTEICGLICAPGHDEAVVAALSDYFLAHAKDWDWLQWSGIPHGSDGQRVLDHAGGVTWNRQISDYYLPLPATWEEFRSGRSRNIKESLRKCSNSLKRDGHEFTFRVIERPDETASALERFFDLHAARARLSAGAVRHADVFAAPRARAFLAEYARCMAERGQLRIFQIEIAGAVVATRIGFVLGQELYLYYSGYDPLWSRYSVMTTVVAESIRWAIEQGFLIVNLSTGNDISKTRWSPAEALYCCGVQISPSRRSWLTYRAYRKVTTQTGEHSPLRRLLTAATRGAPWH